MNKTFRTEEFFKRLKDRKTNAIWTGKGFYTTDQPIKGEQYVSIGEILDWFDHPLPKGWPTIELAIKGLARLAKAIPRTSIGFEINHSAKDEPVGEITEVTVGKNRLTVKGKKKRYIIPDDPSSPYNAYHLHDA